MNEDYDYGDDHESYMDDRYDREYARQADEQARLDRAMLGW